MRTGQKGGPPPRRITSLKWILPKSAAAAYKTKRAHKPPLRRLWAPAFYALASCDIKDNFRFAVPAIYWQALRFRLVVDSEETAVSVANRACNPSVLYFNFTMFRAQMQGFFLSFIAVCVGLICYIHVNFSLSIRSRRRKTPRLMSPNRKRPLHFCAFSSVNRLSSRKIFPRLKSHTNSLQS